MEFKRIHRQVISSTPVKTVIQQSKKMYLPGFHGYSIYDVWGPFLQQLRRANLNERTSAISFNIFMAIPPTIIFLFTLIPLLPISDKFIYELYTLIRNIVPGEQNNSVIIAFLDDFLQKPRNELLSFGLLLALFFSSNAMMGVLRSFDENYEGFYKRTGLQNRQVALKLTLITFVWVFVSLLLLVAQDEVWALLGIKNTTLLFFISTIRWLILVVLIFYIVSFLYRHGPALEVRWPFITPGSVMATLLMVIATILFSVYVNNFSNYNKLYGSISAVFILMLLIYVNSMVLLLGFELNVTIATLTRTETKD